MKHSSPDPTSSSRVVKPQTPVALVVSIIGGALLLLVAIFWAIQQMQNSLIEARMTGTIIEKKFVPAPREEVILDNRGKLQVRQRDGDYSLTVRVRQRDGTTRDFTVSNVPKAMFESVEVGQPFDVGPYVLPPRAMEPILPPSRAPSPAPSPAEFTEPAAPAEATPAEPANPTVPTEAPPSENTNPTAPSESVPAENNNPSA